MAVDIRSWIAASVGAFVMVAACVAAFFYFAVDTATRSHIDGVAIVDASTSDTVTIYRNSFGIPHVVGKTVDDMAYGQGYAHAQDRLWQMDLWRRLGRGRLAEVLGKKAIIADLFMRSVGISDIARNQYEALPDQERSLLTAYARGVNDFIEDNRERLPFEFDALNYQPQPWLAEDCLVVGRVVAFELSLGFWNDIAYTEIAAQRGLQAMRDYVPRAPLAPYVLDTTRVPPFTFEPVDYVDSMDLGNESLAMNVMEGLRSVREHAGIRGSAFGSNCWAVARDGSAILANDPHLMASTPPVWYQIHLTAPGLNALGLSVPGIPFVLSGRNDSLAWGVTNAMIDDVDFILERVDQRNPNYYLNGKGVRQKFRFVRDTIKVAGAPDSIIDRRYTNNSAVISDVHHFREPELLFRIKRSTGSKYLFTHALTFRWTARSRSNELGALRRLNMAHTIDEATSALSMWHAPAFNFHLAHRRGIVRTVVAGVIPIRSHLDPLLPAPSWDERSEWQGIVHMSTLGMVTRSRKGAVASANNRTRPDAEPFISTLFQPSSRVQRIEELIRIYTDMTVRDAQVMQMDVVSPYALHFNAKVLPILKKGHERLDSVGRRALYLLERWDGSQTAVSPAAAINAVFLQRMIWNTFEDELGRQLYYDWTLISANPLNRMQDLLSEPTHVLYDDVRTPEREDMSWIVLRSFVEAVNELHATFRTPNVRKWRFGKIHTVTFPHVMGVNPLMKPVMNIGPFEVGGSITTIMNTEWAVYDPFDTKVTVSARIISDLADSIQYSVLPGGSSGQPLDAHYGDQTQLWLRGGYVQLPTSSTPAPSFKVSAVLAPSSRN